MSERFVSKLYLAASNENKLHGPLWGFDVKFKEGLCLEALIIFFQQNLADSQEVKMNQCHLLYSRYYYTA